jgi:hypothetical protein
VLAHGADAGALGTRTGAAPASPPWRAPRHLRRRRRRRRRAIRAQLPSCRRWRRRRAARPGPAAAVRPGRSRRGPTAGRRHPPARNEALTIMIIGGGSSVCSGQNIRCCVIPPTHRPRTQRFLLSTESSSVSLPTDFCASASYVSSSFGRIGLSAVVAMLGRRGLCSDSREHTKNCSAS